MSLLRALGLALATLLLGLSAVRAADTPTNDARRGVRAGPALAVTHSLPSKSELAFLLRVMVGTGHSAKAAVLLGAGADINAADGDGHTPLHCACMGGHLECVRLLLENGARTDAQDQNWQTALDWTMTLGYAPLIEEFLKHGTSVDARDSFDKTLLMRAVENGMVDLAALLMKKGADVKAVDKGGETALHRAARGAPGLVSALLTAGADANAVNRAGYTPLSNAVLWRQAATVELLLAAGANVAAKGQTGNTALHIAARQGDATLVKALLARGADSGLPNYATETPMVLAVLSDDKETVRLLLDHGATLFAEDSRSWLRALDALHSCSGEIAALVSTPKLDDLVMRKDKTGATLLHAALSAGNPQLAEQLIAKGADIAAVTDAGDTPMSIAIRTGNRKMAELLIGRGAQVFTQDSRSWLRTLEGLVSCSPEMSELLPDWNLGDMARREDKAGLTLLYQAAHEGKNELVNLLLSVKADPNVADAAGMTPLHWAMQQGNTRATQALITYGASLSVKNKQGDTPRDLARYAGLDLKTVQATLIEEGNLYAQSGDAVDARLAYGGALRLEVGASLHSRAAQLLVSTFGGDAQSRQESCLKWVAGQRLFSEETERVNLALAERLLGNGQADRARAVLEPTAKGKTPLRFAAGMIRALCLSGKDDGAATAELRVIAAEPEAGDMGVLAQYFVEHGFDGIRQRRDLLAALDELGKRQEYVAWAREYTVNFKRIAPVP